MDNLDQLAGQSVRSPNHAGVSFRLERPIGGGGMGVAFFALREAPDGVTPVVLKVLRPLVVAQAADHGRKLVTKEVAALTRLGEQIPPTPFVVHFIDAGLLFDPVTKLELPWIALEYMHGGIEGTTLQQRVRYSVQNTGKAFDQRRGSHLLRCLVEGVTAIHGAGVIHRDLTPSNVLACGFGESEIFKVSDLGLARMESVETFGQVLLGTAGYSAPEQSFPDGIEAGGYTDVFSLACVFFYALTGEDYFDVQNLVQGLLAVRASHRRSLLDCQGTCAELRAQEHECRALDRVLAKATGFDPRLRTHTAELFARGVGEAWGQKPAAAAASAHLVSSIRGERSPVAVRDWLWTTRHASGNERVIHSVSWDSDGHALAATDRGVEYWNGTQWFPLPAQSSAGHGRPRCVVRVRAGTWLVGTDASVIYQCGGESASESIRIPDGNPAQHLAGRLEDALIVVTQRDSHSPVLWTWIGHRWMPPLALSNFTSVSRVVACDTSAYLLVGRGKHGAAVSRYDSTRLQLSPLTAPLTRAMIGASSQPEREQALACGSDGVVMQLTAGTLRSSLVDGNPDLSACAVDILDREWVASVGRLWVRDGEAPGWQCVFHDSAWQAPFVSVLGDVGRVLAMAPDGGVVEGQARWHARRSRPVA